MLFVAKQLSNALLFPYIKKIVVTHIQLNLLHMTVFSKKFINQLYIAENETGDRGFIAFVTPDEINPPNSTIALKDALENSYYNGNFVFSAQTLSIENEEEAEIFVKNINELISSSSANRAIIWLRQININDINSTNSSLMGLKANGSGLNTGLQTPLTTGLYLTVQNGMDITLDTNNTITLDGNSNNMVIDFSGTSSPKTIPSKIGYIDFSGSLRGCIRFSNFINRFSLLEDLKWGFQYLFPEEEGDEDSLSEWFPFAQSIPAGDYLGFSVVIDPSDVTNQTFNPCSNDTTAICNINTAYNSRRTYFDFTGKNSNQRATLLYSYFTSNYGNQITLSPKQESDNIYNARLVISKGTINDKSNTEDFHFTPEGDFEIEFQKETSTGEYYMMCGLQGTEYFTLSQKGDTIRFISKNGAFAPKFPFEAASSVKAPESPTAPLLNHTKETAWATILNTSGNTITYVSQPKGSALFGADNSSFKYQDLFVHNNLGFVYTADETTLFPIVPYLGLTVGNGVTSFSKSDTETFESQIISQTRRDTIGQTSTKASLLSAKQIANIDEASPATSTTPSGLLATTIQNEGQTHWNEIFLGQNTDQNKNYKLEFINPENELVEAMQTSDLFLVTANSKYLGSLDSTDPLIAAFNNIVSIDSWELQANVGEGSEYNNYKNIMIIKGRKGKLFDPNPDTEISAQESLIANPKKWTQRDRFGAPSTINSEGVQQEPDPDQLIIVSQWMQSYFKNASEQSDNEYFSKFNEIATDENWTGILILRMDIKNIPTNLQGIMAGITNPEAFNAHHFAVEISPVTKGDGGAVVDQPSTMFGLIYYVDPDFDDTISPPKTISPTTANTYDYRLLSLKVLFENTTVKDFESYSQLTINKLFDSDVTSMENPENTFKNILLKGSFQINNGNAVYSMGSVADTIFLFDSNIYNKIEITNVLLTTRNSPQEGYDESWFSMQGFIDYKIIQGAVEDNKFYTNNKSKSSKGNAPKSNPVNFDIFSFGSSDNTNLTPRTGLSFNNLGIAMIYEIENPQQNKSLNFDAGEITFDITTSTARSESLFLNFALDLKGLIIGNSDKSPQDKGFLTVIPDVRLSGVDNSTWYGLDFKLNMGTPGELAGKVSLDSYLLLSWTPNSTGENNYKANIGISLPGTGGGAKLISLQSVLKLSIGQIRLAFDDSQKSFLLMFTEIALKFLGLLKIPPNGSSLFYLFGNPNSGGKSSGLGWYAMYKKEDQETVKSLTESTREATLVE